MRFPHALIAFFGVLFLLGIITAPWYLASSHTRAFDTNSPPTASDDSYTRHGNGTIGPLLANDSDPDNDPMTVSLVTTPTNGSLSGIDGNSFSYTRNSSTWTGTDSFTYKACDNHSACSNVATVTINIVNQAPVAVNDTYNVHGYTQIGPMMANDSDPDGDPLTYSLLTNPSHGTLNVVSQSDAPYYQPDWGYAGPDSFTYRVRDQFNSYSATATVTINVNDLPPIANADYFIVHGTAIIGAMKANDYDPESDTIGNLSLIAGASHGMVYGLADPPFASDWKQYVPDYGYTGTDSWQYKICDSLGVCSTGTVYILVLPGPGPTIKVPYGCGCPYDPELLKLFHPEHGGLQQPSGPGGGRNSGPAAPDPVNLATGRESYSPEPDLTIYNQSGPAVVWQRAFLSDQALSEVAGYGSPGFTRGWVHNYDLKIQGTSGSWGALTLSYPNGATETLTPQLSGGNPTGAFTIPAGAPYIVTGISGSPTGTWQSISVKWRDQTEWKFTLLSGTTYTLNKITNRMGKSLSFSWNSSRALTQVVDDATSTTLLTLAYSSNGRIATATDAYGHQVAYTFDAGSSTTPSFLQTVSQVVSSGTSNPPAHFTYTYTSDRGQLLNTITVPSPTGSGNSTATINYSSTGKVTSVVDANGNQRVYTYNSGNTQVQVKDASNNIALSWTQKFNTSNLNTGITDAANHSTAIAYADTSNPLKPTSITDRNNHPTSYAYDSFGNVLTVTTPRNVTTTYTWSYTNFALGRLTSVQEGSKPATTISYYEPSGLIQTITRPEPNNGASTTTTTYTYDSLGNVLTVVTPGNNATSSITTTLNYTTDGTYSQSGKVGQPLTITDNLSHVTHLRYDSQGRATSVSDAIGNETDFSYNLVGQPDTTTYPATGQTGSGHSHTVNAYLYIGGPLTSVTFYDENNTQVRQVSRTYGLEGESLSVSGSTEPVTNTYDALYRVKTLKDGNNNTTTYGYNNIGLLSSITMPGSEVTQFTSYDNAGNLLQRIDGNNVTTNYVYNDSESLLTDIQYPASASLNVHFTYDGYGRRSGMTDSTGSQSYSYGNLDEMLSVSTTYTGLSAKTISYSYYPNGSRQSMTTLAGSFSYNYDAAGRPASMTNPFSEQTSWSYQNNDWLSTQTLANAGTATYTYNALGQVTRLLNQISGNTISDFSSIAYDGVGNRTSVTASIPGATSLSGTTGYSYDSKDQITQETSTRNGGFTDSFAYDSAGNPTTFKGVTKTYNSNNQRTGSGFTYDSNGNPTTHGGTTLTFDPENRMTSFGSVLTAGYNGDGLRAWKQNSTSRTYFLYDGIVPVVELDSSGSVAATNSLGANGLVSRRSGSTSVSYSFDSEGNVSQRSDASGNVLSNYLFSAHGSLLSGTVSEPFGYKAGAGYFTDSETGRQLLTNRYYDPQTGRFLTRDPISYSGGINLYAYVGNNPTNAIDPLGLEILSARQYEKPIMVPPENDLEFLGFAANVCAGFGDYIGGLLLTPAGQLFCPSCNPVSALRGWTGGGGAVDPHSGPYLIGQGGGMLWGMGFGGALGAAGGAGAAGAAEGELPGLPASAPEPLGLGNTGRTIPANLYEQLAMEEAMSNPSAGSPVTMSRPMGDPRWPASSGWIKMQQRDNLIHYNMNIFTHAVDDFKFK